MEEEWFPRFTHAECSFWFFHWLRYRFERCPTPSSECMMCLCVMENLRFGTGLLIEALYDGHHAFTAGSNIVAINTGSMTKAKARAILNSTAALHPTDRARSKARLEEALRRDFPGVRVDGLSADYSGAYAPLMGRGGNSLYHTLSVLYRKAVGVGERTSEARTSDAAVVDFCLLCFHLNGQYLLTANAVIDLWSGALETNTVLTLSREDESLQSFFAAFLFA